MHMYIFTYNVRNIKQRNVRVEAESKSAAIKRFFEYIASCFMGGEETGSVTIINIIDVDKLTSIK